MDETVKPVENPVEIVPAGTVPGAIPPTDACAGELSIARTGAPARMSVTVAGIP